MIHYKQLHSFKAVADEGSFSNAAKKLNITQPAVSLQIKSIEQATGLKLFNRRDGVLTLTKDGLIIYEFAETILMQYQNLEDYVTAKKDLKSSSLKIASSTTPGDYILPSYIADFKKIYPDVKVHLDIYDTKRVMENVLSGAYDFGIVGIPARHRDLVSEPLWHDKIKLIQSTTATTSPKSLKQVFSFPHIMREKGSGTRDTVESFLKNHQINKNHIESIVFVGSTQSVIQSVIHDLGLSWVSSYAINEAIALGKVKALDEAFDIPRTFYLISRKRKMLSPLSDSFIQFIEVLDKE